LDEIKLFLITYFAALLGVVPPGLVNMTVVKTCVDHGKRNGLYVAFGASIVIFLQAIIAVLLVTYIFNNPFVQNVLLRAGLVIFILLGIYFFIKAKKTSSIKNSSRLTNRNSIFKGMFIAVLNVFPIPYFYAIATALNVSADVSYDWLLILSFILAAALGSFTTLYFYVLSFIKIEDKADTFSRYSNYFMAALMVVLVIITLLRIYYL